MYIKCFIKPERKRRTGLAGILDSSCVYGGQDGQGHRFLSLSKGFRDLSVQKMQIIICSFIMDLSQYY